MILYGGLEHLSIHQQTLHV